MREIESAADGVREGKRQKEKQKATPCNRKRDKEKENFHQSIVKS